MEELKNMPSAAVDALQEARKPYTPPTAEIIILAPQEDLTLVDKNHLPSSGRWQIGQWNDDIFKNSGCPASGNTGMVAFNFTDDGWTLPTK